MLIMDFINSYLNQGMVFYLFKEQAEKSHG